MLPMVTDSVRRRLLKAALLGVPVCAVSPTVFAARDKQQPALIGCCIQGTNRYAAVVASDTGLPIYKIPIPARGHGVAISRAKNIAVVFARRPGSYFQAFNYQSGEELPIQVSAAGRHFYGHGAFSNDGSRLYATEGDSKSNGVIGVYDVESGLKKIDELSGFGVGPHELLVLADDTLVIGVGGVQTSGRVPVNIATMKPSLTYMTPDGSILEQVELDDHKLSIRHLSSVESDYVVCGQQYRGEPDDFPPLVGIHRRGDAIEVLNAEPEQWARFNHYIASVAVIGDSLLATSPRGNCYGIWSVSQNRLLDIGFLPDASGVVNLRNQFVVSSGAGKVVTRNKEQVTRNTDTGVQWDNHWSAI